MRWWVMGLWVLGCACAPTLENFPCDTEGRCPGTYQCDPDTGTCVPTESCDLPSVRCGGDCADFSSDARHCGDCLHACGAKERCVGGVCSRDPSTTTCAYCPPGTTCVDGECSCEGRGVLCSGALCMDLQQSTISCGACFSNCSVSGQGCVNGTCACAPGEKVCDSSCLDVQTDDANCGDCGRACASGQHCEAGACVAACTLNPTDACRDHHCWDVNNDSRHCGADCSSCSTRAGQRCVQGQCACPPGATDCAGQCTKLSVDATHCGACGVACGVGEVCVSGACACAAGLTRCGSECRQLANDPANCGACGQACGAGQVCANGACAAACPNFMDACPDSACVTRDDPLRCGSCGTTCAPGEECLDGSCARGRPAVGCTSCPCDDCTFDATLCCLRGGVPLCLDSARCPP